jgi:hypothetical protein
MNLACPLEVVRIASEKRTRFSRFDACAAIPERAQNHRSAPAGTVRCPKAWVGTIGDLLAIHNASRREVKICGDDDGEQEHHVQATDAQSSCAKTSQERYSASAGPAQREGGIVLPVKPQG